MLENWPELIKKLVGLDVIWGGRSKKLTGVDDACQVFTGTMAFSALNQSITFSPPIIPDWLKVGCFFRVTSGGPNTGKLFKVDTLNPISGTVTVTPGDVGVLIQDYVGSATIDGRFFVVIADTNIARQSSTGGSMFNANVTTPPRPELAGIIFNRVDHFHTPEEQDVATTPTIYNLSMPVAGTEYSYAFPANTKYFTFRSRKSAIVKWAYNPNVTVGPYMTLSRGATYSRVGILINSIVIYCISSESNDTLEIESWA